MHRVFWLMAGMMLVCGDANIALAVGETVELALEARDSDGNPIPLDANGDVNVSVGEVFHLGLKYSDLRSTSERLGVAKYIADISASIDNALIPALTETQRISFTRESTRETQGTVTFSQNASSKSIPITQFFASLSAPAFETKQAIIDLSNGSITEGDISTRLMNFSFGALPGEQTFFVETRFIGEDKVDVDFPILDFSISGTADPLSQLTSAFEFNPRNDDGTINDDAVPFNLIADNGYFNSLRSGRYSETGGFDDIGGVNFNGPPVGAELQDFDALTIPVFAKQPFQDLVLRINPSNDEPQDLSDEGIILWREDDPIPVEEILISDRGLITINAHVAVPEPSAIAFLAGAGAAILVRRRRGRAVESQ